MARLSSIAGAILLTGLCTVPMAAQTHIPAEATTVYGPIQADEYIQTGDTITLTSMPLYRPFFIVETQKAGMPAWLKWGLIGGAGTGLMLALLAGTSVDSDPPGFGETFVRGFAFGFVVVGGSVAIYQAICKPGGWSNERGLCNGRGARN